jgi:hypothetical protein
VSSVKTEDERPPTRQPVSLWASKTIEWVVATLLAVGLLNAASAREFVSVIRELPVLKEWDVLLDFASLDWDRILPGVAALGLCLSVTWHAKRRPGEAPLGQGWWGLQILAGTGAVVLDPTAAVLAAIAGLGLGLTLHHGYRPYGAMNAIVGYLVPVAMSLVLVYAIGGQSAFLA